MKEHSGMYIVWFACGGYVLDIKRLQDARQSISLETIWKGNEELEIPFILDSNL